MVDTINLLLQINDESVDETRGLLSGEEAVDADGRKIAGLIRDVVAPTSSDDGFPVGTDWVDTVTDRVYVCVDNTPAAAVWSLQVLAGSGAGVANRVAIWADEDTLGSDANLTFDGTVFTAASQVHVGDVTTTLGSYLLTIQGGAGDDALLQMRRDNSLGGGFQFQTNSGDAEMYFTDRSYTRSSGAHIVADIGSADRLYIGVGNINKSTSAILITSTQRVTVQSTEANTSTTNGALVVAGGVGVGDDLRVGGDLEVFDDLNVHDEFRIMDNVTGQQVTEIRATASEGAFVRPTADADGRDLFITIESGSAHTANNPRGGDLVIELGNPGAGGSGRHGRLYVDGDTFFNGDITSDIVFGDPGTLNPGRRLQWDLNGSRTAWIEASNEDNASGTQLLFTVDDNPDSNNDFMSFRFIGAGAVSSYWDWLRARNRTIDIAALDTTFYGKTTVDTRHYYIAGVGVGDTSPINDIIETVSGSLTMTTNVTNYSGNDEQAYWVRIDGTGTPNTFEWGLGDVGSSVQATGVAITGGNQTLSNGITINFSGTTGGTLGDSWEWTVVQAGTFNVIGGQDISGILNSTSTQQATSTTTGAIRTAGGLSVVKNAYIGGDTFITGTTTFLRNTPSGGDFIIENFDANWIYLRGRVASVTDWHALYLTGRRSRGTVAAPTSVLAGDFMLGIGGDVYVNGAFRRGTGLNAIVESVGANAAATYWDMFVQDGTGTGSTGDDKTVQRWFSDRIEINPTNFDLDWIVKGTGGEAGRYDAGNDEWTFSSPTTVASTMHVGDQSTTIGSYLLTIDGGPGDDLLLQMRRENALGGGFQFQANNGDAGMYITSDGYLRSSGGHVVADVGDTDRLYIGAGDLNKSASAILINNAQRVTLQSAEASTSSTNGALVVVGGAGVGGDVNIGGDLTANLDGIIGNAESGITTFGNNPRLQVFRDGDGGNGSYTAMAVALRKPSGNSGDYRLMDANIYQDGGDPSFFGFDVDFIRTSGSAKDFEVFRFVPASTIVTRNLGVVYHYSAVRTIYSVSADGTDAHQIHGGHFEVTVSGSNPNASIAGVYAKATHSGGSAPAYAGLFDGDVRVNDHLIMTADSLLAEDGALWNDSTQKTLQTYVAGVEQSLQGCLFTQTADQTVANTTTETTLLGTGVGTLTLPADFFVPGKSIKFILEGELGDTGTPTVQLRLKIGTTTIVDSGAVAFDSLGSLEQWRAECTLTCRAAGATGTLEGSIWFTFADTTGAANVRTIDILPASATFDTTAAGDLDLTFQWGTADAANTITSSLCIVTVLN